jgi:asparagine synthase (glutamine-hydrolysing)
MCGISGFYSVQKLFSELDLEQMTSCLKHRGPDAGGYFFDGICGLGNRRLKVIDLSDSANQPFYSQDGRYVMVYNGEVYNFAEIAADLKAKAGINFKTHSDTEVIVEAFAFYGIEFVEKFNGMFAIAIFDKLESELYLFRDRLGIKPLYYYWKEGNLAFGSELKAITLISQIHLEINYSAVYEYLHLGYIPAPHSIYQSIFKLDAGSYIKVSGRQLKIINYWNCASKLSSNVITSEVQALATLEELMRSSVLYQMKSDVPFGVFLSGGVDSSLVAAMASKESSTKVNTFSIGFEKQTFNEAEYARKVAGHIGTEHHEFIVSYKNALPLVEQLSSVYDEPYADSSAIPTMLVSKMARQHVTVVLSGDGGDELFLGYGAYKWAGILGNPLVQFFRTPLSSVLNFFPTAKYKKASALLNYHNLKKIRSHIFSQEQSLFSELDIASMKVSENGVLSNLEEKDIAVENRILSSAEQQALFDINYYLKEDLLTKIDRAAMLSSLETRVPYLDHRIVEFAINLSPTLKVKNGETKYLLKKLLYRYLPKHLFERRKQGFSIPLSLWLRNELRHLIDDYLKKEIIEDFAVIKYEEVEKLKRDFFSGKYYIYNKLWLLIILHKWFKEEQNNLLKCTVVLLAIVNHNL